MEIEVVHCRRDGGDRRSASAKLVLEVTDELGPVPSAAAGRLTRREALPAPGRKGAAAGGSAPRQALSTSLRHFEESKVLANPTLTPRIGVGAEFPVRNGS
jgi:hypothetical protein